MVLVVLFYAALIVPIFATIFELMLLISEINKTSDRGKAWFLKHTRIARINDWFGQRGFLVEIPLYIMCFLCQFASLELLLEADFSADWTMQLHNNQKHQPIADEFMPTVVAIIIIFLVGLIISYLTNTVKTPPLITALSISALYLGCIYSIIWTAHLTPVLEVVIVPYFLVLPVNTIFITARLLIKKAREYVPSESHMSKIENSRVLSRINKLCTGIFFLPVAGLFMLIPLIGIMIIVLLLFGQSPDAAIKAFTETSDFLLSTKVSPQNLIVDEHYLCTVAAGGNRKIVKPLRRGIRHGHTVTVNRQLEVANAFEEVIMVRTPVFHRHLRHFYDTYGFPVARLIKSKLVADFVYFIMKPFEYIFVIVLYLTEVHPEDRIALQYTGTTLEKFSAD